MREKWAVLKYAIIAVAICSVFTITVWFYLENLHEELIQENYMYLREVAGQSSVVINHKFDGDMRMLRAMAIMLGSHGKIEPKTFVDKFKNEPLFNEFQRIGIILPDGRGYASDVAGTDFSDREYFKQAMAGKPNISDVMPDRTTKILSSTYAVPIVANNEIVAVLAAVTNTETYQNILYGNIFDGKGYIYVVKSNGDVVIRSNHPKSSKMFLNLFAKIDANAQEKKTMQDNMLNGQSGNLSYSVRGEDHFLNYVPLGIKDWYVVSVVPYAVIKDKSLPILKMTAYACLVVVIVLSILILYLIIHDEKAKKSLTKLAYYDELTGIPNKNLFYTKATEILQQNNKPYAYVVLDINKFKVVNDLFSYEQGDELLKHIASVIQKSIDRTEIVARVSADVFHLLFEYKSKAGLEKRLQTIANKISSHTFNSDNSYNIAVSFGIYILEKGNICIEAMGDKAGIALRKAKGFHQTSCFFYNDDIRNKIIEEQEIENCMGNAIQKHEFKVYLQPKYSLKNNAIEGAEALVRWEHPEKGLLVPMTFIPLFERNGFIVKLDMYVLETVCQTLSDWRAKGWALPVVSVNQSRMHLHNPKYIPHLLAILERYNISPEFIELEITESVFFEHSATMVNIMNNLHKIGFKLSMDDFGAGYSSLNMLREIMVDVLKVDKNFFRETANNERGQKIVSNIISMASDLGIKTVAEGVETLEQVEFLRQTDCNLVQGYYFYRPITIPAFEKLLFQS